MDVQNFIKLIWIYLDVMTSLCDVTSRCYLAILRFVNHHDSTREQGTTIPDVNNLKLEMIGYVT